MKTVDIAIVGSGSLAQGVVHALSQSATDSLRTAIIGRSLAKATQLASIANARAVCFGASGTFLPIAIPEFTTKDFSRVLQPLKPKVILFAASIQSPWEGAQAQNAWTKLIAAGGFGITLPLQLSLIAELSEGLGGTEAAIVNACYPDCVNVVLHRTGLRVTCGIGNAAIVEAFCRSHESVAGRDVRVVGHHGHFGSWLKGKSTQSQPRVWVKGREQDALSLRPELGPLGEEMNSVTSSTAVPVLMALLSGDSLRMSIPGVKGMRGGYPFALKRGKFSLRLPSEITLDEAIAHNRTGERLDGLDLESGVKFAGKTRRALTAAGFEYAQGFDFAEWPEVRDRMVVLRDRLRKI